MYRVYSQMKCNMDRDGVAILKMMFHQICSGIAMDRDGQMEEEGNRWREGNGQNFKFGVFGGELLTNLIVFVAGVLAV